MSKPKFIKDKIALLVAKQKTNILDNEEKKKIIAAELRKIKLEDYKKANQKSRLAIKSAKVSRPPMTAGKHLRVSPRKQLMMKKLQDYKQAQELKKSLRLKETRLSTIRKPSKINERLKFDSQIERNKSLKFKQIPSTTLRKPPKISVKKNLINQKIERAKIDLQIERNKANVKKAVLRKPLPSKSQEILDDLGEKTVRRRIQPAVSSKSSKSKDIFDVKPKIEERFVLPLKDEELEVLKPTTTKFGIKGDNRKQILLGLAKKWNADNKAEILSKPFKPKNFFQLRGNLSELIPTFYTAFPGDGSKIKPFKSASDCLTAAWIKMRPI